jgi:sialic acid synthase SpsE
LYIIAEAAQGYLPLVGETGSGDIALLMAKAAAVAGASAVKFQIVYVDELAQKGNIHYDIFRRLEMTSAEWKRVADYTHSLGIHFVADVFGEQSLAVARDIGVDGIKIHSTSFFDHQLIAGVLAVGCPVYFSMGGIESEELAAFVKRHKLASRSDVTLLYGFQAEPTPMENNRLARIPQIRAATGLPVGFMDHSDGAGPDDIHLSVLALGFGVTLFEKHVTLDRELELEDYVSAVGPKRLGEYCAALRRLEPAIGTADLSLTENERTYRQKAVKRTTAARDLAPGTRIAASDLTLIRPPSPRGAFDPDHVIGKTLRVAVPAGTPIAIEDLE